MATANEILSYNPQPDLAFGSTSLPAFSNAAVWDTTPAVQFWANFAQNKLNTAKALRDELAAKQLKEQEQIAKALDQGQYKIWDADRAAFNPKWDEFREEVIDVVNRGAWNDINDEGFIRVQKMQGDLDQFAQFSTQQQKHYEVGENDYRTNPAKWRNGQEQLAQYKAVGDPYKRADTDYNLQPEGGWDVSAMMKELVEGVARENPDAVTATPDRFGNVVYSFPVEVDRALLNERINAGLDATRSGINGYEYEFSIEPENVKAFYSTAPDPARAWAYDMALAAANLDLEAKNSIHQINYAPSDIRSPQEPIQQQPGFQVNFATPNPNYKVFEIKKDGQVTGYVVKDQNGKNVTFPEARVDGETQKNVSIFPNVDDANLARRTSGGVKTGTIINAWLPTKTAEFPSNLSITAPEIAYDAQFNKKLDANDPEILADAWTIDLIAIEDWYRNKKDGKLAFVDQVTDANRDQYEVVRLATVKKPDGGTFRIPYDRNISVPLSNALKAAKVPLSLPALDTGISLTGGAITQPNQQNSPPSSNKWDKYKR